MREIAAERGFAVAAKPDSHDICFIPDGDTRGFLARRLGSRPGPVVDAATGATVGRARRHLRVHRRPAQGASGVAVGDQRPRYVLGIEPVSRTVTIGTADLAEVDEVRTGVPTWTGPAPELPFAAEVQLRAHGTPGRLRGHGRATTAACASRSPSDAARGGAGAVRRAVRAGRRARRPGARAGRRSGPPPEPGSSGCGR